MRCVPCPYGMGNCSPTYPCIRCERDAIPDHLARRDRQARRFATAWLAERREVEKLENEVGVTQFALYDATVAGESAEGRLEVARSAADALRAQLAAATSRADQANQRYDNLLRVDLAGARAERDHARAAADQYKQALEKIESDKRFDVIAREIARRALAGEP